MSRALCLMPEPPCPSLKHQQGLQVQILLAPPNIMYTVKKQTLPKYGKVIEITRDESGLYKTPGLAYNEAISLRRHWRDAGATKVRLLIDGQILTLTQAEQWSNGEYKNLPKCHTCNSILKETIHTHRLNGDRLFCGEACADIDYMEELEKIKDEEEIDYL